MALNYVISVLFLLLSYVIGSIPFGIVVGKLFKHIDIREYGSKNIGSTNAIRVLGKKIGYIVFFLDVFKGMFVIIILKILEATNVYQTPINLFYYGAMAIIGHCFSIFLDFKGGKAVATSLGVVLILTPIPAIACLIVFVIILYSTGYVSLASTGATITVIVSTWLLYAFGLDVSTNFFDYFITSPGLLVSVLYSILSLLIIFKHFKNYKRLLNGTENSFKKKKKENIIENK